MPPRPRLVILRALGIGDLLTAVPALRALADHFADHERVLAAPALLAPLVGLIEQDDGRPTVDRLASVAELAPLPSSTQGADVAVNLHGRGPQSHERILAARARRALWFEHPAVPASRGAPHWRSGEHEVERWCRMLQECGLSADPGRLGLRPPAGEAPRGTPGATVIHPGAGSPARCWPPERFAAVARAELHRGRPVVVTGSHDELSLAREVAERAGLAPERVLAGRLGLLGLARAVAAAGSVVCGDTGVAHLATALGAPSVLLFGPTPPAEWGPPADRRQHRVLWAGTVGDPHAERPHAGLLALRESAVLKAIEDVRSVASRVLPDSVKAEMHRKQAEPGSA